MTPITVAGAGYYVPEKVLTNFDLEKILETNDEWIVKRTGIRERRIAAPEQAASDLALPASLDALKQAGITAQELDYIIMATVTPDTSCPCGSNVLQGLLDAPQAVSFDVSAACSGFIFALDVASKFLAAQAAKNILVVASEVMSRVQDWTDRSNCILWGDGAGAVVLKAGEGAPQLLRTFIASDGAQGANLRVPSGGSRVTPITCESVEAKMHTLRIIDGANSLRTAVAYFAEAAEEVCRQQGISTADVDLYIPHQANMRFLQPLAKRLHVHFEEHFFSTIHKYGNTSSSGCIIAMAEAWATGRIQPGMLVCMPVFGGGLTWGAALIQF